LRRAFPQLDVRIESDSKVTDLETSDIDVAIRAGAGPWPGDLLTHPIGAMDAALVCAPALARRIHALKDLEKQAVLEIRQLSHRGLAQGLRAHGLRIDPARVQLFETYYDVLRAAEHGLGVATGVFPLTTHWVTQGKLAIPFAERARLPGFMAVVHRTRDEQRFPYVALADWLRKEYDSLAPLPPGRLVAGETTAVRKSKVPVRSRAGK
jgi:LysR family glycine cleavage system transcriptional activator